MVLRPRRRNWQSGETKRQSPLSVWTGHRLPRRPVWCEAQIAPQALERRNDPSPRAHAGIWNECPISRRTSFSPAGRIYRARVAFSRNLALAGRKTVPRDAFPDMEQNSRNEAAWAYFNTYLTWHFTDSQLLSWHHFNQIREIRARQRLKGQIRDPWLEYSARNLDFKRTQQGKRWGCKAREPIKAVPEHERSKAI